MQLASKIPDIHVQLWGSAILKGKRTDVIHVQSNADADSNYFFPSDLHRMSKDASQETEAYNNHLAFSKSLLDQFKCTKFTEHSLIYWYSDDAPTTVDGPATVPLVQTVPNFM